MSTITKEQVLHSFWSSFGVPAYEENSVPDSASMPYITYQCVTDRFNAEVPLNASIWTRNSSWSSANTLLRQIEEMLSNGGKLANFGNFSLWIKAGVPFAQRMGDENDNLVKRILLFVNVEYFTEA